MKKKILLNISILTILSVFLLFSPKPVHASILDNIVNGVKNLFSPYAFVSQELNVVSKIELAPNGDINKNGKIDAGDTIKFTYTIVNTTGNASLFNTLKTNIDTGLLNSISSIEGASSINDTNHTITVPNLYINPNQLLKITFEVRTNFNKVSDEIVSTEPELIDRNNNSLVRGQKQEVTVNKMNIDEFNRFVHVVK